MKPSATADFDQRYQTHLTYRWRHSKTKKIATRTASGAAFLWLLMQHVLPKGFRRARTFGFLHPNCHRLIALLRLLVFKLPVSALVPTPRAQLLRKGCGSPMVIVRRRILPTLTTERWSEEFSSARQLKKQVLEKTGLKLAQIDVIELNEAFAAQGLAVTREHGLPDDAAHVNPNGGAITIGHPLGASVARLITTAIYHFAAPELRPKNVRDGPRRLDRRFFPS